MAWLMKTQPNKYAVYGLIKDDHLEKNCTPVVDSKPVSKKTGVASAVAAAVLTVCMAAPFIPAGEAFAQAKTSQTQKKKTTTKKVAQKKNTKKVTQKKNNRKATTAQRKRVKNTYSAKNNKLAKPAIASASIATAIGLHKVYDPLNLGAGAALIYDAQNEDVLYAKNPEAVLPIASITKLMTALIVVESGVNMDEVITITREDIDTEKFSSSRLAVGSRLTRRELLHLALMSSENRAAHALGRAHPGGLYRFVSAMNAKAQLLGMHQTRYVDPTGLSKSNQSSPMDLVRLVSASSAHPMIERLSTNVEDNFAVNGRNMAYRNTNALVRQGDWDITLQKTGYIREAGRCLVMEMEAKGRKIVMVLLDSATSGSRVQDARKMYAYAIKQLNETVDDSLISPEILAEDNQFDQGEVDS